MVEVEKPPDAEKAGRSGDRVAFHDRPFDLAHDGFRGGGSIPQESKN
jgi:hypothetical protein